ncbi:MAG: hypothetical protein Kow00120_19650 [Anaerolineae bacterium]
MRHFAVLLLMVAVSLPAFAPASRPTPAQTDPITTCADLLADYAPVVGTGRHPTPGDVQLPPVRAPWLDPVFGACIVRVTDRLSDFDAPQVGLKNEYSRVQAFNADESLIMVRSVEANWFLYDTRTLEPLQMLQAGVTIDEPRWDAQNPYRFTFSPWWDDEMPKYMVADLTPAEGGFSVTATLGHDFASELPPAWETAYLWRRWEGSPSNDSRYDVFMAEDDESIARGLVTYDWQADAVLGLYAIPHGEQNEPDNVGMSPLGTYALAQFEFCEGDALGAYAEPCGAMVYTRDLSEGWGIARSIGHNDVTLDAAGREVVVYQASETDQIVMTDLETGETTPLLDLDFSGGVYGLHISGRAFNRPGWVAVSVHPEAPSLDFDNPFWMVGTVFALELKAEPRVIQLAHHHAIRSEADEDYFAEPQVTVNRDFTRLLFTSNWARYGAGEVEMYMIVLPEDWFDRLL